MKRAILVVGAPRSGTSVVAHVINRLGVNFGDPKRFVDVEKNKHNPIFFELQKLNEINNEIFSRFNKKWADFDWQPLATDFPESIITLFDVRIKNFIESEFGQSKLIGLKDPRFCFTLLIWVAVLERIGYKLDFVFTSRNPNGIFASNNILNKVLPSARNFRITVESILAASYFLKNKNVARINYDQLIRQPKHEINLLCERLNLENSLVEDACSAIVPNLNHGKGLTDEVFFRYFDRLTSDSIDLSDEYERLRETKFALTFERDEQLASLKQAMAERDEQLASLKQAMAERDEQLASLKQAMAERDEQLASLKQAMAERDELLSSLNRGMAEQTEQIVILATFRDELLNSTSWRITKPIRFIGYQVKRIRHFLLLYPSLIRRGGGILSTAGKTFTVLRQEGLTGVKQRLVDIQQTSHRLENVATEKGITIVPDNYVGWIRDHDMLTDELQASLCDRIIEFQHKPLISVVMPTHNPKSGWLIEAIESVRNQIYPHWELCIVDDASTDKSIWPILSRYAREDLRIKVFLRENNGHISEASNSALKLAKGAWIALLDHDDLLSADALFWVAHTINKQPHIRLIYSDEDKIDEQGNRSLPFFKPDWSPHLMLSQAYLGHLVCYQKTLIDLVGGFDIELNGAQDYGLALSCATLIEDIQIKHIPRILYHWRMHAESTALVGNSKPYAHEAGRKAVGRYIQKKYPELGMRAVDGEHLFTYKAEFELPAHLKVSIIIPTKDGLEYLKPCIDSILGYSTWKNVELIIIDNGSKKTESIQYLRKIQRAQPCVQVVSAPIPFNWSKLNNIGAENSTGNVLIFMNNDTQVISPSWIEYMAGYTRLPNVGTVGALLLFKDGSIQHSGVVVGMGGWSDHVFRTNAAQHTGGGPFVSPVLTRNVLAVTGACMAISRERFDYLGGFDESFIVCGSDVEIGLRAHKHGFFNVMCSEARLFHYESKTRTPHIPPEDFFQSDEKYAPYRQEKTDPYYNPNLSLEKTTPTIKEGKL